MKLWKIMSGAQEGDHNIKAVYDRKVSDGRGVDKHLIEMLGNNTDNQ